MSSNAPIAIVAYNRPDHLESLLDSLIKNNEAKDSKVYFFVDKFKNSNDRGKNREVINICSIDWGFKQTELIINEENLGLKKQILKACDYLADNYEYFIILEDDLVVSRYFLNYMNKSLKNYKEDKKVFHINGYNFKKIFSNKKKSYFSKLAHPWGWGTWSDRWKDFRSNEQYDKNLIKNFEHSEQRKFNFFNLGSYINQLEKNEQQIIFTWAVFWYQYIFLSNGYSITPGESFTENKGFDGTGVNSGLNNNHSTNLNLGEITKFSSKKNIYNAVLIDNYLWHIKIKVKNYFEYHIKLKKLNT